MEIIQGHHIIYDEKEGQEEVVNVFKGEHMILTKLKWFCRNHCSKGFIKALKHWIILNEDRAEEI